MKIRVLIWGTQRDQFIKCLLLNEKSCYMTLYIGQAFKKHQKNICSDMPARLSFKNAPINLIWAKIWKYPSLSLLSDAPIAGYNFTFLAGTLLLLLLVFIYYLLLS